MTLLKPHAFLKNSTNVNYKQAAINENFSVTPVRITREDRGWKMEKSKTRLHFPARAAGGVRGRLFLARLPKALPDSRRQPGVLDKEVRREPGAGPARKSGAAEAGLARPADLGTRRRRPAGGVPSENSSGFELKTAVEQPRDQDPKAGGRGRDRRWRIGDGKAEKLKS